MFPMEIQTAGHAENERIRRIVNGTEHLQADPEMVGRQVEGILAERAEDRLARVEMMTKAEAL